VRLLRWLGFVLSSIMTKGPLRSCHHLQMIIMTTTVYQPKWIIGADALIDDGLLEDCQKLGECRDGGLVRTIRHSWREIPKAAGINPEREGLFATAIVRVRVRNGQLPMARSQIGTLAILDSTFRYGRYTGLGSRTEIRRKIV